MNAKMPLVLIFQDDLNNEREYCSRYVSVYIILKKNMSFPFYRLTYLKNYNLQYKTKVKTDNVEHSHFGYALLSTKINVYMYVYICVYMCVCMYVCVCVCVYIYIYLKLKTFK